MPAALLSGEPGSLAGGRGEQRPRVRAAAQAPAASPPGAAGQAAGTAPLSISTSSPVGPGASAALSA